MSSKNVRGNGVPKTGALLRNNSSDSRPNIRLIVTSKSQTGDVCHVAAALALDANTDVLIVDDVSLLSTDPLMQFFRNAAKSSTPQDPGRVRVQSFRIIKSLDFYKAMVKNELNRDEPKDMDWLDEKNAEQKSIRDEMAGFLQPGELKSLKTSFPVSTLHYSSISLKRTTWDIADKFKENENNVGEVYGAIAKALASRDLITQTLVSGYTYNKITFQKLPDGKKPVLLLWARYSGGNSMDGYNPKGDSDPAGQNQILKIAAEESEPGLSAFDVITIGHDPTWEQKPKYAPRFCELGEFYKANIIDGDRAKQMTFFLALMQRYPGNLYQIGQKTGGMDGAALLGIPTVYIEHGSRHPNARMMKWADAMPFYRDADIQRVPSLLGQAISDFEDYLRGQNTTRGAVRLFRAKLKASITNKAIQEARMRIMALRYFGAMRKSIKWELNTVRGDVNLIDDAKLGAELDRLVKEFNKDYKDRRGYDTAGQSNIKKVLRQLQKDYAAKGEVKSVESHPQGQPAKS